ncbi:hypothetical protein ACVBEH_31815, partial [Roseateles sp. GG27B]
NGQAVGSGREAPLNEGDRLQIGGYVLAVKKAAAAKPSAFDDPFADLLGSASAGVAAAPALPRASAAALDPLAAFGFEP